jgi:tetraacyldisaccharide-1-P 4'-kinase
VKRNQNRFPADFMFELTAKEKAEVVANSSASSPQSNASRLCFLLIGSSCHAVMMMTALAMPERLPAVLRSVQTDSPANPEPVSYPLRRPADDRPSR